MTILCPTCPVCGEPPTLLLSPEQVFCGNEDCPGFSWDMTKTRQDLLDNVTFHNISGWPTSE